eukprot:TRINITY_DN84810_c0_g1_i1.p1 TRINITY_DN84810_c0_g1~~TRINITY_DN84810_c0_g1_i1.p1  ORF type:complete len:350 (-),score=41.80 TRINITY_DN84810_c0_g1_i1:13-1062(-)
MHPLWRRLGGSSRTGYAALGTLGLSFGAAVILHRRFSASDSEMAALLRAKQAGLLFPGRTAVVVGATSGIGEGCALRLAQAGYSVIAVGRDANRGALVVQACAEKNAAAQHSFRQCDSFSLKNVRQCAEEIAKAHPTVDALVMTQGMATVQGFTPTVDGNDEKLTLHYWSRMYFTTTLLPALCRAEEPRVISVLSGGVHSPFRRYKEDPELRESYSIKNAADAAGYYNDLGLDALAHENPKPIFVHSAPGFVNTRWGTEMPWYIKGLVRMLQPLGKSPADAAECMLAPIFRTRDELLGTSGSGEGDDKNAVVILDQHGGPAKPTELHSPEARDFIWERTQEVLQRAQAL